MESGQGSDDETGCGQGFGDELGCGQGFVKTQLKIEPHHRPRLKTKGWEPMLVLQERQREHETVDSLSLVSHWRPDDERTRCVDAEVPL